MSKPKYEETTASEDIQCPWCGEVFGGIDAAAGANGANIVACPFCSKYMQVRKSIKYTAIPCFEEGEKSDE